MNDPLFAGLAASDRATVGAIAHALSGSASTFGFAAISVYAEAFESAVDVGEARLVEAAKPLLAALNSLA